MPPTTSAASGTNGATNGSTTPTKAFSAWSRTIPLVALGAAQVVVWTADPFGVHTALNDGRPMTRIAQVTAASLNGGLWFLLAYALASNRSKTAHFLAPYAVSFTANQWLFWWWPYLLGPAAGLHTMIAEHKGQLSGLPVLLPSIGTNLVPSVEHTLLQPLSILGLLRVASMLRRLPRDKRAQKYLRAGTACFMALNVIGLAFAGAEGGLGNMGGSILTTIQVALGNYILWRCAGAA